MKQCEYEDGAIHSDCNECDEDCNLRKPQKSPILFIILFIAALIFGKVLSMLGVW